MGKMLWLLWLVSSMAIQQTYGVDTLRIHEKESVCYEGEGENACVVQESLESSLRNMEEAMGYTSQINILALQCKDGTLIVDLSKELVAYGGGNEAEYQVICWLLKWGFEEIGVESVTILVEGKAQGFPEGTSIQQCTREHYNMYYK